MAGKLKVSSETLNAKAAEVDVDLPTLPPAPNAPCELTIAQDATGFLKNNLQQLDAALKAGRAQNRRLAACLRAAAAAYDAADAAGKSGINATELGGGGAPITPDLPPAPAPSDPVGSLPWMLESLGGAESHPSNPGMDWEVAASQINSGDQGASMIEFGAQMAGVAAKLAELNGKFNMAGVEWEGAAAEAAEKALTDYSTWLTAMTQAANNLAVQAIDLSAIHGGRRPEHPSMQDVADYENASVLATAGQAAYDFFTGHATKQQESDTVRARYAQQATIRSLVTPPPPNFGSSAWPAVKPGDVAKKDNPGQNTPQGPGGGGPSSGGGGGTPSGGAPAMPESPSVNPASAGAQKPEGGGSPSGGSPSGGDKPSGGSGQGSPSGGMPGGLGGDKPEMPSLPDSPSVSPASAGGGSGGGAGGGGLGGQPMQPAAVAPALGAAGGAAAGGASQAAGRPPVGGGMGGGMGGMGHGGGREGGKEKKRNANLSPDEVLYKEDRAFTDGVIGHRRRTKIDDKKDTK